MGGLIVVVMLPMLLPLALLYALRVALPLIMPILLAWNVAVLAVLALVYRLWKRSGTMGRDYLSTQPGWKRVLLTVVKYGLILFSAWEILLVVLCGAWIFWGHELL